MKFAHLTCTLLLMSASAFAQDANTSYSFGGSCGSQGSWTQNALQSTQTLKKITTLLKDNPNCKALGVSTQQAIADLQSQLNSVASDSKRNTRLSQIPNEINALRSFGTGDTKFQNQVMKLMMNRSIEGATLSAQVGVADTPTSAANVSSSLQDFGTRMQQSTKSGLGILNKVIDSLPQMDQCLAGNGQQELGNFISASIQVATAFAGSGQDSTAGQMATLVSKLTNVIRERKYTQALRQLNQQEFTASMACLMEVTSESYCQARDAMSLFRDGMKNIGWRQEKGKSVDASNPFLGYYVLNTHVPNITRWMQKIQIGVDPMLPTDAQFQNKVQQEVTDFYKSLKTLLGDYNSSLLTIRSLKTVESQQNEVLKMVTKMTGAMSNTFDNTTNFFTMNKTSMKIPFYLIGMDEVPDQVAGRANGVAMNPDLWLQAHFNELPQFKDPVALAETIGRNVQALGRDANISVIAYFNKWYIVDKQALVGEAVTDVNYTVKDSLHVVHDYLDVVIKRVGATGDATVISTMMDTQKRIDKIIAAFDNQEAVGKEFAKKAKSANLTAEDIDKAAKGAEDLVNIVFDQFMVMKMRSGFLANRLVLDVYQDYIQLLKSPESFNDKQKEIFIQAGMAAMDKMLQMYNGNPTNVQSDLNMALSINKQNIDALAKVLKDNVVSSIAEFRNTANGRNGSSFGTMKDSAVRLFKDAFMDGHVYHPLTTATTMAGYYYMHSDRYPFRSSGSKAPESEFGESTSLQAQFCIQALAFYDQSALASVCSGSVLLSPFRDVAKDFDKGYDMAYNERLSAHTNDANMTPEMKRSLNYSDRICAFRDYNRHNMVLFMSLNKKQN